MSSLHTAVYHLRKAVGGECVQFESGRYRLRSGAIAKYDVSIFVQGLDLIGYLNPSQAEWLKAAREILELYTGPFMDGEDELWILERRTELERQFLDLAVAFGQATLNHGKAEIGLPFLRAALKQNPYREDTNTGYMELLFELGRRTELVLHYRQYCRQLEEDLGMEAPEGARTLYLRSIGRVSHSPRLKANKPAWHSRDRPL